jgi:hypothetical protein
VPSDNCREEIVSIGRAQQTLIDMSACMETEELGALQHRHSHPQTQVSSSEQAAIPLWHPLLLRRSSPATDLLTERMQRRLREEGRGQGSGRATHLSTHSAADGESCSIGRLIPSLTILSSFPFSSFSSLPLADVTPPHVVSLQRRSDGRTPSGRPRILPHAGVASGRRQWSEHQSK